MTDTSKGIVFIGSSMPSQQALRDGFRDIKLVSCLKYVEKVVIHDN